jgi:beta-1,4-N-acetylglucosaminyltransferase
MTSPLIARPRKLCFVTIGATASFDTLISTALSRPFLEALREAGYTDLRLQFGREGREIFDHFIIKNADGSDERCGLNITGFEYNKKGLGQEMRRATAYNGQVEGVVVSHAGALQCPSCLAIAVSL